MRLSISALLICAAWCLYGCQGTMNHTLIIPEVVHAERSGNDLSIGETRLFLHRHDGLRFDSASRTLYLDSSISLKILYYAGTSINDSVELFHGTLESVADTDHRRMYYIHDFQMDSCPARIYYLKSIVPGKEEMALFLEDNAFSAGELALFPAGQPAIRDSLLKVMLSLYVDEGEGEVENMEPFTMDLSHSEFRYCNRIGQAFFYTVGGKSNPHCHPGYVYEGGPPYPQIHHPKNFYPLPGSVRTRRQFPVGEQVGKALCGRYGRRGEPRGAFGHII